FPTSRNLPLKCNRSSIYVRFDVMDRNSERTLFHNCPKIRILAASIGQKAWMHIQGEFLAEAKQVVLQNIRPPCQQEDFRAQTFQSFEIAISAQIIPDKDLRRIDKGSDILSTIVLIGNRHHSSQVFRVLTDEKTQNAFTDPSLGKDDDFGIRA